VLTSDASCRPPPPRCPVHHVFHLDHWTSFYCRVVFHSLHCPSTQTTFCPRTNTILRLLFFQFCALPRYSTRLLNYFLPTILRNRPGLFVCTSVCLSVCLSVCQSTGLYCQSNQSISLKLRVMIGHTDSSHFSTSLTTSENC